MTSLPLVHRACLVVLLLAGFVPRVAGAQQAEPRPSFADVLYEEGDFFRAITEYRRTIHLTDDEATRQALWMRIGTAYLKAGRYTEAADVFSRLSAAQVDSPARFEARFLVGLTYLQAGTSSLARKQFNTLVEAPPTGYVVPQDRLSVAVAASWFQERKWDQTAAVLEHFAEKHPHSELLPTAQMLQERARRAPDLPRKSPLLAGLLSAVVPGLGQFYEGRWGDGVQALLINAVLGGATAASIYAEYHNNYSDYVVPAIVGAGFLVFYGANVYGAVNGARMTNIMTEHRFVAETKQLYLPVLEESVPDVDSTPAQGPNP